MANIGKLSYLLTASAAPLEKALGQAKTSLTGFATSAKKSLGGLGNSLTALGKSAYSGLSENLSAAFEDPGKYAASWLKMIPGWGQALALPFEGVSLVQGTYQKGAAAIKDMGEAAMRAGLDLGDFQLLVMSAGGKSEQMERALFKMGQKLAEIGLSALTAKDSLEWIGLNGRELAGAGGVGAYARIAEAIKNLGDRTLQTRAAFEIFGKTGKDMLPFLLKGQAGIDKARERIDRFGLGFGAGDLANIRKAEEAGKSVKLFWAGLQNQVTLAVAPVLAALGESTAAWAEKAFDTLKMKTWSEAFVRYAEVGATAVAGFLDALPGYWGAIMDGAKGAGAAFEDFSLEALTALKPLIGQLDMISSILSIMSTPGGLTAKTLLIGEVLKRAAAGTLELSGGPVNAAMEKALAALEDRKTARLFARASAEGFAEWLDDHLDDFGDARGFAEDILFGKAGGGAFTDRVAAIFASVRDKMKPVTNEADAAAGAFARWFDRADALKTSLEGPLDVFKKGIAELTAMWGAGVFRMGKDLDEALGKAGVLDPAAALRDRLPADLMDRLAPDMAAKLGAAVAGPGILDGDAFHRGLFKSYQDLIKANPPEIRGAGALLAGSKEAASAIAAYRRGGAESVQEAMKRIMEEALRVAKEEVKVGKEVKEAVEKIFVKKIG